ncbi:TetR/AcrR family transcriptional regulator [Pigmentiphaga aceris]|uniref:TetR/AcrR family transcriptional regulator n=1 Tax=Pigmentiphaga aceris TaxID=1940612 RepID=UPI00165243CC|nr:TetR/AcrR family transcriptional regulator [Pigmentiphaga aceris]
MTARPRGRPRSEAATVAVLDAAYRLCAAEGLRGATMQAIATQSGVSKMTIYKWWDSRLALLIDAYLRHATLMLPISETDPPVAAIRAHALRYVEALQGDLGRVQMAVLCECWAENGNANLFVARYLSIRRELGVGVIRRGQANGDIPAGRAAEALYDQIYGTIFYRYQFGLGGIGTQEVNDMVMSVLR